MKGRALEVKVGILVTLCGGLLIAFIVLLGDFRLAQGDVLYMDTVTSGNLKPGAHVKIAGVRAGKVTDVIYRGGEIDEKTGRPVFVRVKLTIESEKFETLRKDAALYITSVGVLGEKYVEIHPGSGDGAKLSPGDVIEGRTPMQLELVTANVTAVLNSLSEILAKNRKNLGDLITATTETVKSFRGAAKKIEGLVDRNESRIDKALGDFIQLQDDVSKLVAGASHGIGDGENLRRTITDLKALARDLRVNTEPILKNVRGAVAKFRSAGDTAQDVMENVKTVVGSTAGKMEKAFAEVEDVVSDVKVMTQRLKAGKGTVGALLSDTEMYEDIKEMVKDLKRHPWKFLWKQ